MPVSCAALQGVMLGVESGSVQKFAGIILSVVGSICMVRAPRPWVYTNRSYGSGYMQKFAGIILSVVGSICMVRTPRPLDSVPIGIVHQGICSASLVPLTSQGRSCSLRCLI